MHIASIAPYNDPFISSGSYLYKPKVVGDGQLKKNHFEDLLFVFLRHELSSIPKNPIKLCTTLHYD